MPPGIDTRGWQRVRPRAAPVEVALPPGFVEYGGTAEPSFRRLVADSLGDVDVDSMLGNPRLAALAGRAGVELARQEWRSAGGSSSFEIAPSAPSPDGVVSMLGTNLDGSPIDGSQCRDTINGLAALVETSRRPGAVGGLLGSRDGYYVNAILHVEPGTNVRFSAGGDGRTRQDTLVAVLRSVRRQVADSSGADR